MSSSFRTAKGSSLPPAEGNQLGGGGGGGEQHRWSIKG